MTQKLEKETLNSIIPTLNVRSKAQFFEVFNVIKNELAVDGITAFNVEVAGWNDDLKFANYFVSTETPPDQKCQNHDSYHDYEYNLEMNDKWIEFARAIGYWLIHWVLQANFNDNGSIGMITLNVKTMTVDYHKNEILHTNHSTYEGPLDRFR